MGMIDRNFDELAIALASEVRHRHCVTGLTAVEILDLERGLGGGSLPLAYRSFMMRMGRDAGLLLAGTDAFYPKIIEYQDDARELISDEGVAHLFPVESIIFAIHQGYQVYWMPSGVGEDPPVFMYQEGDLGVRVCLTW